MIDATPSVRLLTALGNQNLGWVKALAELVDNAFDANATRVVFSMSSKEVVIEDDGQGMKDIASVLRLGDHQPNENTALGMYGVGLKDAWLFAGNKIEIESVRGDIKSKVAADVSEMIASNSWFIEDPLTVPTIEQSGTRITLHLATPRRRQPGQQSMENLAWAFTPALLAGRQIAYRASRKKLRTLAPVQLPKFTDSVVDSFSIEGKEVHIEIGILADGQKMTRGPYWVQYKHRNLTNCHLGTKSGFSDSRMGGIIRLGDGFSITKNKDDFESHKDELDDAIHDRIKFLLQKAEQLSLDVESRALTTELESRINDAIGHLKKEKRDQKREQAGTVAPGETGRKRTRASKVSDLPGGVTSKGNGKKRGLSLGFYDLGNDSMGDFDPSSNRITLNESHPYIAHCRSANAVEALHTTAIAILANHICNHADGKQITLFEVEDFSQAYGTIMKPMAESLEVRDAKRG